MMKKYLGHPSNANKLRYDLLKLTFIKLGKANSAKDEVRKAESMDFLQLMKSSWSSKLAKVALLNQHYNNMKPFPLP